MHANARPTIGGRNTLIERIEQGRPVVDVAGRWALWATAYKWWARFRRQGWGLVWRDGSSRPHRCPHETPRCVERRIESCVAPAARPGPIGGIVEIPHSTVHRVLARLGLTVSLDGPYRTGRVHRRIHTTRPGELVHIDVKKLGGSRPVAAGEPMARQRRPSLPVPSRYASSIPPSTALPPRLQRSPRRRTGETCAGFWNRAHAWFDATASPSNGPDRQRRVLQGHAFPARSKRPAPTHAASAPPPPDQRQGRTLQPHTADEWAYVRVYRSDHARTQALTRWLHLYNHHRSHTSLGGQAPMETLSNLPGHYI